MNDTHWYCPQCGRTSHERELLGEGDWLDCYCPGPCYRQGPTLFVAATHRTQMLKMLPSGEHSGPYRFIEGRGWDWWPVAG